MRPILYYFWSNKKQEGYDNGLAARSNFIAEVVEGGMKQSDFVNEHVESMIRTDKIETGKIISRLQNEIDSNQKIIDSFLVEKDGKIQELNKKFNIKNNELEDSKNSIQESFLNISTNVTNQLSQAKNMLDGFVTKLGDYISDGEKYCNSQANRLKDQWNKYTVDGTSNLKKTIRDVLIDGIEEDQKEKSNSYTSLGKDLGALLVFIILSIYDMFFGKQAISDFFPDLPGGIQWFLAILFVPAVIFLVHFSSYVFSEKAITQKVYGKASILAVIIIILVYIGQSLPDSVKEEITNPVIYAFLDDGLGAAFRLMILPSLFVGEIILETVNWDNLWGKNISKFFLKGLTALRDGSISKWAKNERLEISQVVEDIKNDMRPDYSKLLINVTEIKNIIDPIYDNQIGKKGAYEENLKAVESKIEELKIKHEDDKKLVENDFIKKTAENSKIIMQNTAVIKKLNKQLSNKEDEARSGFLRGLNI